MLSKYQVSLGQKLHWLNPNVVTVLGIIPQVLFFYFMMVGNFPWAIAMLILSPLDMLDGLIARANNKVTAFGGFLDSTVDRVGDFLIIAGLYAGKLISLELAAALILITFLISYTRSRAELASNNTIKFNYGLIQRAQRIVYIIIVLVLYYLFPTASVQGYSLSEALIAILAVLSVITLLQRIFHAYKKLN